MRNGRPVFALTEFSEKLREQYPNEEDFWAAVDALERPVKIAGKYLSLRTAKHKPTVH